MDVCIYVYICLRCILNMPLGIVNESNIWFLVKIFHHFGVRLKNENKKGNGRIGTNLSAVRISIVFVLVNVVRIMLIWRRMFSLFFFLSFCMQTILLLRVNEWHEGRKTVKCTFDNNFSVLRQNTLGAAIQISVAIDNFEWSSAPYTYAHIYALFFLLLSTNIWVQSVIWNS